MNSRTRSLIEKTFESKATEPAEVKQIESFELIQKLWNNYGDLLRVCFSDGSSAILKHIQIPQEASHPKGFNTDRSRQRKINSYRVETTWYEKFNEINLDDQDSRTPQMISCFQQDSEFFILLEDLDQAGFSLRKQSVNFDEVKSVLKWLASFHAKFLKEKPEGLWPTGSYWHLETRPDELRVLGQSSAVGDQALKTVAPMIDQRLKKTQFQTIIHGDAKLANFCFNPEAGVVAAVDFQYVGGGCGMKDVAYFIGSCLSEEQSEKREDEILDFYFHHLLKSVPLAEDEKTKLEQEWRGLYYFAWADFHRFLKGWSPGHWKVNSYSEKICTNISATIFDELLEVAKNASKAAGETVRDRWKEDWKEDWKKLIAIETKGFSSPSSDIVTEVDFLSQKKIIETLQPLIEKYDFGLLAEESEDDQSRFVKDYFWSVDPLDGTLYFAEGQPGFAISIALIDRAGFPLLGVVYDPVKDDLFHAVRGQGAFVNGEPIRSKSLAEPIPLFADRSLKKSKDFAAINEKFEVHFTGGSVMNAVRALTEGGCYFKFPKKETGGCAVWDLAATSLLLREAGGAMTAFSGETLNFNKRDSLYYNHEGLMVCGQKTFLADITDQISQWG